MENSYLNLLIAIIAITAKIAMIEKPAGVSSGNGRALKIRRYKFHNLQCSG
jgi:hypothetical protein